MASKNSTRNIDLLTRVGTTLYGNQWQTDLARALELSDARRVRQWIAGERSIPASIWPAIEDLLRERADAAHALLAELQAQQ